ncbi:thiamine pyrophosphate-binding protein, partial [Staphylococcus hominis]
MAKENYSAADMVIDTLKNNNVDYVFGIPGAKIDYLFDALEDDGPELIVTRHEQNAAMMAQGVGRLTGKPGVALVTSGPGVSNLTTGLLTATSEGDPVLAIGGQVKRNDLLRLTHQAVDNAALLKSSTKYSAEVQDPESLSEVMTNAIRTATSGKNGASFISIPQDVISSQVQSKAIDLPEKPHLGVPTDEEVNEVLQAIKDAKFPVLLAGMRSSSEKETEAIRKFVEKTSLPVVETFQGAGVISRELEDHFFGRVGLFRNQVGDELLRKADLVVAIGY